MKTPFENSINIVASTDENYWHYTAVMLLSLISNHHSREKVVCHIIASGLSDEQKEEFVKFFNPKGLVIEWLDVDPAAFKDFPVSDYFTQAAYYRIEIPQLISSAIKKVIYLDSDILLLDDISKLWHLDTQGFPMAAVENFYSFHKEFVGIPPESMFFNSGVMVIDLEYWRRHNVSQELKRIIVTQRDKMIYCDQEALNLFFYDKCFFLPLKWNFCPEHEDIIRLFELYTLRPGLKEAMKTPSLVHFLGVRKPDKHDDFSSYTDLYRSYAREIPFLGGRAGCLSITRCIRKSLFQLRQALLPYWLKRFYLQINPREERLYWPALPDWYW